MEQVPNLFSYSDKLTTALIRCHTDTIDKTPLPVIKDMRIRALVNTLTERLMTMNKTSAILEAALVDKEVQLQNSKQASRGVGEALPIATNADLDMMEAFVRKNHLNAAFFPGDARTLAGFVVCVVDEIRKRRAATLPAAAELGLPVEQEPKYTTDGAYIINRASGERIPHDEPIFILRAQDKQACGIIGEYQQMCNDPAHCEAVESRFIQFGDWAEAHPERMKEPDTAAPLTEFEKP